MSQVDENIEEELVPGASGCLLALVVIAMFACYGLGIITGGFGQRYLDSRKAKSERQGVFPDPEEQPQADPFSDLEAPLAEPLVVEHAGARLTLDLATARFTQEGVSGEVKLPGLLLMRLRFKNVSNRPMELTSWMHSDVRTWPAQLEDNQGLSFVAIHDSNVSVGTYLMSLPQYRPVQSLASGEETTTWVAFTISVRPVNALRLSLSAVNYGGEGMVHIDIPAGVVSEGNPID
jgi:hypothetical protein